MSRKIGGNITISTLSREELLRFRDSNLFMILKIVGYVIAFIVAFLCLVLLINIPNFGILGLLLKLLIIAAVWPLSMFATLIVYEKLLKLFGVIPCNSITLYT